MSDFTKTLSGFRYVQTHYGDTLQRVAARELGDASKWSTLAWMNDLLPPYLTDDQEQVTKGVLLTGTTIRIPAASAQVDAAVSPDEVFLVDCALVNGEFQFEGGDFAVVSGRDNLRQSIAHRVVTDHGELLFHQTYGANLGRLKGAIAGPSLELVAQSYVKDALQDENRIQTVAKLESTVQGDRLSIRAEVVPISGTNLNILTVA